MHSERPGTEDSAPHSSDVIELRTAHGIALDYLPVPERLQPYITTLFYFACDRPRLRDYFPAIVGLVSFTLAGESSMVLPGGKRVKAPRVALLTPTSEAMSVEADGPYHSVGAVFSPLGWASLTGLHAEQHADRLYDGVDHLGAEVGDLAERLCREHAAGEKSPRELVERIAEYLLTRAQRVKPRHVVLIRTVAEWMASELDPPLASLFERCAYSERQVERLVQRYYGCPPKMLVRKYRALRVMALLLAPDTTPEQAAALVDLYYDQSHMIRDIRKFAGRTPTQMADNDTPVLAALVDIRNYRAIRPRVAPLPGG